MRTRIREKPARETPVEVIKPLALRSDEVVEPRQAAGGSLQVRANRFQCAPHGVPVAQLQFGERIDQLRIFRHRPFGSLRRGRRARVGNKIEQRPVRLVPNRGDQRDAAFGGGANDDFLIEAPEILQASAASADDQHVGARNGAARLKRVEATDGGCDFGGGAFTLYAHWPEQHARGEALVETVEHVANDCARWRGDNADDLRQKRPLLFPRLVKKASAANLRLRSSSSAINAPAPAGSSASMTI
jgi:hypothetical protein